MRFIIYLIIAAVFTASAAGYDAEQYPFTADKDEFSEWIEAQQKLMKDGEGVIQSYIQTEKELENLDKARYDTEKAQLDLWEKYRNLIALPEASPFSPKKAEKAEELSEQETEDFLAQFPDGFPLSERKMNKGPMPTFIINDVRQFIKEGHTFLEVGLENVGDAVDAIVAITSKDGVIIAKPYFEFLKDFGAKTILSFMLMEKTDELTVKIDAGKTSFKIPVSLHPYRDNILPTMNVTPFSKKAKVGSFAEYFITLEGDASLTKRYQLQTLHLPKGISSTFLISENNVPVSEVKFSASKKIINLVLRLTLSPHLETKLIGKAIPFLVALSSESVAQLGRRNCAPPSATDLVEQLTITPLGKGKIAISSSLEEILLPLGQSKTVTVTVENIGTADIPKLEIFTEAAILGISAKCMPENIALPKGETKDITITIFATETAKIGTHFIKIAAQAEGVLCEEVTLEVQVKEGEKALFLFATLFKPSLFFIAIAVFIGIAYIAYTFGRKARIDNAEVIEEEYA